jgi:hypothetical protein
MAAEAKDLLQFSYNPFDEMEVTTNKTSKEKDDKVDFEQLDKIVKYGEILRVRPDTFHYESFYGVYQTGGSVLFDGESLTLLEFLRKARNKSIYNMSPQTRSTTNPLRYIEVYYEGQWRFILKIINPKAQVPAQISLRTIFRNDLLEIAKKRIGLLSYFELEKRLTVSEIWKSLPEKYKRIYETRISELYTCPDEPMSNENVIPIEFVEMKINEFRRLKT